MKTEEILKNPERFKINLGLKRMEKILSLYDNPQNSIDFIHVAGTNGKGSVCAVLEAILIEDGRKVGKYTSPHLFNYTERFSVNGKNIDAKELEDYIKDINKKDKEYKIGLTEFEILTTVCFLYFKKQKVDIAILETGLGGRLDATNIIKKPLISIITSISKDHTEKLGDTIEKIAYEKAGIFKKNSKAIFLKNNNGYKVLYNEAKLKGAKIITNDIKVKVEKGFALINDEKVPFSLNGDFQAENLKLAIIAAGELNISFKTIKAALSKVKWMFRMQEIKFNNKLLLLDSCHNPDGARVLNDYINKYYREKKIKFIFGCLNNKDYNSILSILYNKDYDFCFYEFDYPNSLKFNELKNFNLREIKSPVKEIIKEDYDVCIISGSIYMLGCIFKNFELIF